ncbi:MAG: M28 family peptidase [Abditibacteriota bacterium]|nr:M28 family peptidase [Abditibacteriota bacterium]
MRKAVFLLALLWAFLLCSCNNGVAFDGDAAYRLLESQTRIGDRSPGTPGARKCVALIKGEMSKYCSRVYEDRFTVSAEGKKLRLTNIVALQNPAADKWVLVCSHWDNRPFCDREEDKALAGKYCPGANDGASSCAVLMETARQLSLRKPKVGVIYVFFDGEDYGHTEKGMYLGSTWFAKQAKKHFVWKGTEKEVKYGILLDMIGDSSLNICKEALSGIYAGKEMAKVWKNAADLGYGDVFIDREKYAVHDDHIPLNEIAGIPTMDIIDFDYPYWHTTRDTADKCSPESLKKVGDVVLKTLLEEKP